VLCCPCWCSPGDTEPQLTAVLLAANTPTAQAFAPPEGMGEVLNNAQAFRVGDGLPAPPPAMRQADPAVAVPKEAGGLDRSGK
jgi:hypothetical protein